MARTVAYLTPGGAETKTTTFPAPGRSSDGSGARPYLAYDASADEAAYWTFAVKVGGDRLAALAAVQAQYPSCGIDQAKSIAAPVLVVDLPALLSSADEMTGATASRSRRPLLTPNPQEGQV